MSKINLSKVEIPKRSKSMSLHPPPEINNLTIKQIGDYALGEEIGSGAFGKVVLGKHILTGEKVAIKILDKMILNQTPEDYELVKKEISILKLVKHKFIVQLYEIMQTAQHIFIIMEYCEGKEIMDYILTKTRLSELESLKYFQQLINTLFYLHSQNIAHRDVKIDNILLDKNHDLKLIDFGLSTKYTDDSLLDQPCGTIVYAAPEVLEGKEYHGMLADVWSSGIVLFGMLAGFLPFSDKNDDVNKNQVIKGEIKFPDFFPDLVTDLLKHMLDVDPMTRYTLQEIKDHPWFNSNDYILIPGIIIDYNIIPVDEKILNLCVTYNKDKNEVFDSVRNNKHDSNSALYYLLVKKLKKKGFKSVSDLCSDDFIDYILDEHNLINQEENNDNNDNIDDNGDNCDNTNSKTNIEENKEEEIIFSNDNIDNIDNVEFIEQNVEKENKERENIDRNEFKDEEINILESYEKEEDIIAKKSFKIEITEESKEKEILNEKNENENIENNHKQTKLSDLLNESYSQKSNKDDLDKVNNDNSKNIKENISNKNIEINLESIDNNTSITINKNNSNKKIVENIDNIENNINDNINNINNNNNSSRNNNENNLLNENNNIKKTPQKLNKEEENKNIEEKRNIVENEENQIKEEKSKENILERNITPEKDQNKKLSDIKRRNLFEEIKNENENDFEKENNGKEEADLGIQNLSKKLGNDDIEKNDSKEEIIPKIEHVEINISQLKENNFENIKIEENQINENENKIICEIKEVKNIEEKNNIQIQNPKNSVENKEQDKNQDNNHPIINIENNLNIYNDVDIKKESRKNIDTKITFNINKDANIQKESPKNIGKENNNKIEKEKKLKKYNNDIQVIGIKINKNDNKRYQKTKEKAIKPKLLQNRKNNINNVNKNIFNTNQKLFSYEKSNTVLNNLLKSQSKYKPITNPKVFIGTESKNNKNRSVFKIAYNKNTNTNKKENFPENSYARKNSSKNRNVNFSNRNTKKKILFTKSKPELESKQIEIKNKNQSNFKKKNSNEIFSLLNNKNKNNFYSTGTEFKIKSFINNSSQNYKSSKNVKKVNLQNKFEEVGNNYSNKDKINDKMRLSLNNKESTNNKSNPNKNNSNKKYNAKKNYINNNYASLMPQSKKGFNNINTINNNILKSIIGYEKEDRKIINISPKNVKKNNKSLNNMSDKKLLNTNVGNNKMNKKKSKHLESSVINNRHKSPIGIRELSESPKQKYFNNKTRYARMPWKIKKKAIDEKAELNLVYNKYINRIINPFNQNNSKIVNYKFEKNKKINSIRNSNAKKILNKTLWTRNIKKINIGNYYGYNNWYNKKNKNKNNIKNNNIDNSSKNKNNISKEKIKISPNKLKNKIEINNKLLNKKNSNNINYDIKIPYTPNKNIKIKHINLFANSNLKLSNINSLSSMNFYTTNIFKTENRTKNKSVFNTIKKTSENQNQKKKDYCRYLTGNKYYHKHSNSVSSNFLINLKNRFSLNNCNENNIYNPIDLSCLFFRHQKINEFCEYIKNKLKNNSISYILNRSNVFICNKNDYICKIEINKMNNSYKNYDISEKNSGNIFYLKMSSQKERHKIKQIFKQFVQNLE